MVQEKKGMRSNAIVLGAALTLLGGAALIAAPMQDKNAFVMSPGLEGCLAAGSVGLLLALLGGLQYARVVALGLPIFLIQALSCWKAQEPSLGVLGLEMLGLGLVGVLRPASKVVESSAQEIKAPASAAQEAEVSG